MTTECQFWDVTTDRAGDINYRVADLARLFRMFDYPLDGHGKKHLEAARDEINRVLAEDEERERGRNAA